MYIYAEFELYYLLGAIVFFGGAATFAMGVLVLVTRAWSKDEKALRSQTAQLVQKGLAADLPGLVGNASALLSSMQDMVRTASGIGLFLMASGAGLMYAGIYLFSHSYSLNPNI